MPRLCRLFLLQVTTRFSQALQGLKHTKDMFGTKSAAAGSDQRSCTCHWGTTGTGFPDAPAHATCGTLPDAPLHSGF